MRPTVALYGTPERGKHRYPTFAHDHCATVMDGGRVVAHLELERNTRVKHDNRLPELWHSLIENNALTLPDSFDLVAVNAFHAKGFASACGRYRVYAESPEELVGDLIRGANTWP